MWPNCNEISISPPLGELPWGRWTVISDGCGRWQWRWSFSGGGHPRDEGVFSSDKVSSAVNHVDRLSTDWTYSPVERCRSGHWSRLLPALHFPDRRVALHPVPSSPVLTPSWPWSLHDRQWTYPISDNFYIRIRRLVPRCLRGCHTASHGGPAISS